MKKINRFIAIFIAIISLCGVVLGGCDNTSQDPNGGSSFNISGALKKYDTKHIYNVKERNDYLVQNGASDYKIVYPAGNTNSYVSFAVQELHDFFQYATGVDLTVITDDQMSQVIDGKFLSVGPTASAIENGFVAQAKELNNTSAYIIKSKDNAVYMVGNSHFGTLYAVYTFLRLHFNYEIYASDEIAIDTGIKDKKALDFDVVDVPDFEYRQTTHGELNYNLVFARRMRMQTEAEVFIPLGGETFHNYLNVVPVSKYYNSHPEWFNSTKTQLVLTQNVEELSDVVVDVMKEYVLAYPDGTQFTFTQEDGTGWGDDEISKANYEKYGTHAVEAIRFIKIVAKKLQDWLDAEHPDRKITIVDFAYSHTLNAPVRKKEDGSFELMEDDLVYPDNAAILFCTTKANHYFPITHDVNKEVEENIQKWKMVTNNLYAWTYQLNYKDFFIPFDIFNSIQANNCYFYENGVKYLYNQFGHVQPMGSDWYRLKEYIASKLAWDIQLDMNTLYQNFFDNYFKDASQVMFELFRSQRDWFAVLAQQDKDVVCSINTTNILNSKYWSKQLLKKWLKMIDDAYQSIEPLKIRDYLTYKKVYDRINLESLTIRYLYLKLYPSSMNIQDYQIEYSKLVNDCLALGFTRKSETQYDLSSL